MEFDANEGARPGNILTGDAAEGKRHVRLEYRL
jgi:hypothetical protein